MDVNLIKLELIQWLSQVQDEKTLAKVQAVCKESDWWDALPDAAKAGVEQGLDDVANERVVEYKKVRKDIKNKFNI